MTSLASVNAHRVASSGSVVFRDATLAAGIRWHVLYVKSRQEKALGEDLSALNVKYYLPVIGHPRFYGKKRKQVQLPLFPGYLFLLGTIEDAYVADRTKRVARMIQVADQAQLDRELRNLDLALASGIRVQLHAYLPRGTAVEVTAGPLKGLHGVVDDSRNPQRLILQVQMLASAVSLEIDGALVHKT